MLQTYIFSGEYYYDNLSCGKGVIFHQLSPPSIPAAAPVESPVGWGPLSLLTWRRDAITVSTAKRSTVCEVAAHREGLGSSGV
jgi:hypothetical protein